MKRSLLLTMGCVGFGAAMLLACGGKDKPPMTPDSTEMPAEPEAPPTDGTGGGADGGAEAPTGETPSEPKK